MKGILEEIDPRSDAWKPGKPFGSVLTFIGATLLTLILGTLLWPILCPPKLTWKVQR
jgi:hypothetical protein